MPRAPRFPMILPVRYRTPDETDWSYGMTIDISRSGVLFRAGRTITREASVELEVILPGDIEASARVVGRGTVTRTFAGDDPAGEPFIAAAFEDYELLRVPREPVH